MIKRLFLAAALVAPGLAYAGNPSANLPVQIVPAGAGNCRADGTAGGQTMNYTNNTGTATLYWNDRRQVIDGFGADEVATYQGAFTTADMDLLFTLNGGGIGLNLMRVSSCSVYDFGPDCFNEGSTTIPNCSGKRGVASRGALLFSTQDTAPPQYLNGEDLSGLSGLCE
jgi:hypothetical protein